MDFQSWLDDVNGRVIGDGQCVALAEDYIARVCALPAVSTDPTGYAGSMFDNGPASNFGQLDASATAMPGYLAVWGNGPFTPLTHVAPVVQDGGAMVKCMSQNPGPAHYMDIPKIGLKGYLTPGGGTATASTVANVKPAGNVITDAQNALNTLGNIGAWLGNASNWRRVGLFIMGAILLYIAVAIILKDTGAGQWTISTLRNTRKTLETVQH